VREQRLLPESPDLAEVEAFLADLGTRRDRAMVLLMLLGGLRAAEVRALRLPDVDIGRRQVRVSGKGGRERVVPVDRPFFTELAAYLRDERSTDCATTECFVVLRGPTAGQPLSEAGMRRIFRTLTGRYSRRISSRRCAVPSLDVTGSWLRSPIIWWPPSRGIPASCCVEGSRG
jgi:integrase/recombinase XerC